MDTRVCSCRKWELTRIPCKHVVTAIYNMSENGMGVGIREHWVHAAYRLKIWAHVYSFKIKPCNGREIWPLVDQAGARQAAGARNVSSQVTGSRNASSQATSSSQPSAAPNTTSQGPTQHSA
ncbi:mutator type transposase [Tanacetum coccineum]